SVVGVADVATHRQSEQLAHEMIFKARANDLPLVVKIFGADEADDGVDEKRLKHARDSVGAGFERELVHAEMRFGGKSAALASFEVHYVVACPRDVTFFVMLEDLFAAFTEHLQCDSEAVIGGLGPGDRLKEKIDRRAAPHGC